MHAMRLLIKLSTARSQLRNTEVDSEIFLNKSLKIFLDQSFPLPKCANCRCVFDLENVFVCRDHDTCF